MQFLQTSSNTVAMNCFSSENTDKRRFPLRAVERFCVSEPNVSVKCCHAISISGDMNQLLQFLPTAVMRTFNRHPRLRALIVDDQKFIAEVQPQITLRDVETKKLFRVREISDSNVDIADWKNWNHFVQSETAIPFDRFTNFMFYLTVWVNWKESKARFFLFSDHIMSDGDSGQVFVNDCLEDVALLSIEAIKPVVELPLRPSLYEMWMMGGPWWLKPLAKTMLTLVGGSSFVNFMKGFKPLLTPRDDQNDFCLPFKENTTVLLSQAGTPTNMRDTLRKCKEENVTMGGALIPAIVLAYYHASKVDCELNGVEKTDSIFRLVADVCYNMRQRISQPVSERQVGLYVTNSPLQWLITEGVNLKTVKFWDLARTSKAEMTNQCTKLLEMSMPCFLLDRKLIKPKVGKLLGDFKIPSSCTGDATISNLGGYLYKHKHILACNGVLEVEDMFAFCAIPYVATSTTIWLTSVNAFNYSLAHKVDKRVGNALFHAYVNICEALSNIEKDATMEDVLKLFGLNL
ncbi:hypothetical protein F442_01642 [Plasmopara halstedii]|uniref:Alcohol acetyltransferase n=1 Tax=Plasmopara halstedii TaxID=4781 RepID=A0A0P1ADR3_PLAHL|nr:hypothetical protein F442_01642 [Plasmopara halstedii]CEG39130.1 hypothetical protein F442_01642 [Plasmopara halstedii]|eukprot:XP_024575499.1 hypothetical protein F442_01642 [Plasmopara halstedii]